MWVKNQDNRTLEQQVIFEQLDKVNLKTAQSWHVREKFKSLFDIQDSSLATELLEQWMTQSMAKGLVFVNDVIKTIKTICKGLSMPYLPIQTVVNTRISMEEYKQSLLKREDL